MRKKIVSGILFTLLMLGMLTLAFNIQPAKADSVPTNHAWIHGQIYKNQTYNLPLVGILLELWNTSSNTLVANTTSSDSDVNPGAFDFGYVYTGSNRTFFIRVVAKGYNNIGYNMLDVVNHTTASLISYDSQAFTCYSEQDYYCDLCGPDEADPTTIADEAINIYYYVWLVYDYFRERLNHYVSHVTARITSGIGGWGSPNYIIIGVETACYDRRAVFGHEYAHSIMFQIYSPYANCNSTQGHTGNHCDTYAWNISIHVKADPDFGNDTYPVPCSHDALSEGWANFVPGIVYSNYIYTPSGFPGKWADIREGAGEKNEYGFAGILADIFNIPRQNQNTMMSYIWEVISKDQPRAVNMFYEDFVTRHPELADDMKITYLKRFAMFSRLGIEVNATENDSSLHVNVSGYLMPFPHPNKTVTVNYRLVGDTFWTWLADVETDNSSFYSVKADLPEEVYEFQASWSGDRDHHTGHYGSVSDIVRTDENYIGSVNGLNFYTDKSMYQQGETVQIRILNANYTQKTLTLYLLYGVNSKWPIFYNFSYADFYFQIFYPDWALALNRNVLIPPFYGTTYVNFTNTVMGGSYTVKAFNKAIGSMYIEELLPVGGIYIPVNKLSLLSPYIGLTILSAVVVVAVVYAEKRKRNTEN